MKHFRIFSIGKAKVKLAIDNKGNILDNLKRREVVMGLKDGSVTETSDSKKAFNALVAANKKEEDKLKKAQAKEVSE